MKFAKLLLLILLIGAIGSIIVMFGSFMTGILPFLLFVTGIILVIKNFKNKTFFMKNFLSDPVVKRHLPQLLLAFCFGFILCFLGMKTFRTTYHGRSSEMTPNPHHIKSDSPKNYIRKHSNPDFDTDHSKIAQ